MKNDPSIESIQKRGGWQELREMTEESKKRMKVVPSNLTRTFINAHVTATEYRKPCRWGNVALLAVCPLPSMLYKNVTHHHMQLIKEQLYRGLEALEIFPRNQEEDGIRYLWVMPDEFEFPFGLEISRG